MISEESKLNSNPCCHEACNTPKFLTERLRDLERLGIKKKEFVSEYTIRVEYSLSNIGRGIERVIRSAVPFL
jgi:DNA-binding HxlR family transcriptional regulator